MTAVHRCQWCDQDYPCHTFIEGEDEHGHFRSACDCKAKDECPGCSEHGACEDCGKAPAGDERSMFRCTPCADKVADSLDEAAYEASLSDFYGGSGPVTINERMAEASALDRSQK